MLTAIVSDLHLGMTAGTDIALRPAVRERLAQALEGADRIVLLGDLLELRERPMAGVLEMAAPALDAIGQAAAGKQVLIVPGNHDHELIAPALDAARIDDPGPLVPAGSFSPDSGALSRRVAAHMSRADVVLAYPGVWLREDVYATHGHYLDLHLTVPRMECVLASAIARFAGDPSEARSAGPDDYEAALAPHLRVRPQRRAALGGARRSRAAPTSRARCGARQPQRLAPAHRRGRGAAGDPGRRGRPEPPGAGPVPAPTSAARSCGGPGCGPWAR